MCIRVYQWHILPFIYSRVKSVYWLKGEKTKNLYTAGITSVYCPSVQTAHTADTMAKGGQKGTGTPRKQFGFLPTPFCLHQLQRRLGEKLQKKYEALPWYSVYKRGLCAVCPPRMRTDIFTHVYNTDIHIVYIYVYIGVCGYTLCLMIDILSGWSDHREFLSSSLLLHKKVYIYNYI